MKHTLAMVIGSLVFALSLHSAAAQDSLIALASRGDVGAVKAMLEAGANPNAADADTGLTALTHASSNGHSDVVRLLLAAGANVRHASNHGITALVQASIKSHSDIMDLLIANGADVNSRSPTGFTPLMWTVATGQKNRSQIAAKLVRAGADVNLADMRGKTALMLTPFERDTAQVQAMFGQGDDDSAVTKVLLDAKARIDAVDNTGKTALDYAEERGRLAVAEKLRAAGARRGSK